MIKSIIIEDEYNAIELLKGYIDKVPFLECLESFRNPIEAISFLQNNQVDLIFLDINMPELSGISFLKAVKQRPAVILTTAYSEYAVESYEYDVQDYLLKPISFERFLRSVTKIETDKKDSSENDSVSQPEYIYVKDGYENIRVSVDDILYLEKDGNYITYHIPEHKLLSRQTIQQALEGLGENFIQIHKSYIINLKKIESFSTSSVRINDKNLPVGLSFRARLAERVK